MQKTCSNSWCAQPFEVTETDLAFYRSFDEEPLSECFECIQKHHLSFRNGRKLYQRRCDATGKTIISSIAPEKPYKVYDHDAWYSDRWDALSYGRPFDFSKPFFGQFRALQLEVPRIALFNINPENSDYCNMCIGNKNCYLIFGGDYNEDSLYGTLNMRNRNVIDCDFSNENELSFSLFNAFECYGSRFVYDSKNCTDCAFISDCIGCSNCILCTNLRGQSYCIENEHFSKEEYEKRKLLFLNGSFSQQRKNEERLAGLCQRRVVKEGHYLNCEACTGDYIENSKGCTNCFFTWKSEDCRNSYLLDSCKDTYQTSFTGHESERCYHIQSSIRTVESKFTYSSVDTYGALYGDTILNCQHVFGCVGLHHKTHCILNKQYTEEEYNALVPKVVDHMRSTGEWGQYFPKEFSCFGYNESTVSEIFPLSRDQAIGQGFQWRDLPDAPVQADRVIPAEKLPDSIDDIPDDILSWAILCEETKRPFKIVRQELDFYRKMRIPVPHLHPDVRYMERMRRVNHPRLWSRPCGKCGKSMESTYAPVRSEYVLCEQCYLTEVY